MPYKDPGTKSQSGTASTPAEKSTGTIDDWLEAPARKNSTASLSTANGEANGVKTPQGGTPFGSTAVHNTGKDGLGIENDSSAKTPNQNQPESDDSEMPKEVYINSQKDLDAIIMTSPAAVTPLKAKGDFIHQVKAPTKSPSLTIPPASKAAKNYDRKTAIHMGIKSLQNLMNHVSIGHDLRFTRDGSHTLNRLISQTYHKHYYNKQLVEKEADLALDSSNMPDLTMWAMATWDVMEFLKTGEFKYPLVIYM